MLRSYRNRGETSASITQVVILCHKVASSERQSPNRTFCDFLAHIFSLRQHDSIYSKCLARNNAIARPSVRLSARPSHGWISQKLC